jgi:cytochrome P450 / NADPH-cytochrome P450 reductase
MDIDLSFAAFLQLLPSMRVRQYSISSSPLANPQRVSLTVSVLAAPSIAGRREPFLGVASTYLASLRPGDKVQLAVRPSSVAFRPPTDLAVPLVMFCAGSGLAPMRGFLQERAAQKQAGREVAQSLLFFGCRSPQQDYLYGESDLKEWAELGIVDVRTAFSRDSAASGGCKYIQEYVGPLYDALTFLSLTTYYIFHSRVWKDREAVVAAWNAGSKVRFLDMQ